MDTSDPWLRSGFARGFKYDPGGSRQLVMALWIYLVSRNL